MSWKPTATAYGITWLALAALSGLTLALSFASLGPWGAPVGLGIAAVKALLIALVFMHLAEQRPVNALALGASLLLVAVFIGLATADVATRDEGGASALPEVELRRAPPG